MTQRTAQIGNAPQTCDPVTVGTTAVPLASAPPKTPGGYLGGLLLTADPANTGTIYVGSQTTWPAGSALSTANGIPLVAGASVTISSVGDPAKLYAIASTAGMILRIHGS